MARGASTFRERDLRAAIHAVEAAGKTVVAAEITRDGVIRVIISRETVLEIVAGDSEKNEWDADE